MWPGSISDAIQEPLCTASDRQHSNSLPKWQTGGNHQGGLLKSMRLLSKRRGLAPL